MTDMNPDFQYGQQPPQMPQPNVPPVAPVSPQPSYTPQPPVNNYMTPPKPSKKWFVLSIVFITTTLLALGAGGWALYNYFDQKDNVDAKVSTAVTSAVKERADKDAAAFLQKEKQPNRQFAGPDDYGRLSFDYPKTWSIYVDKDTSSGDTYAAYFNPVSVPPVKADTQYALRVTIEQKDYEKVIASYDNLVKDGSLTATAAKADATDGTRLEGSFTKDIRGIAVIFKIRDKTVTLRTDAETFRGDFDALVSTITFNK
ncbi:MAG: hypothetical protein JWN28_791 [Candidatus Saccharibacteria bacterium]|nr:hypothetical protein [Candidatus Saccharibacteria bacterium]